MSCVGVLQRNTTSSRYMYINIYREDLAPGSGAEKSRELHLQAGDQGSYGVVESESKGLRARGADVVKLPE